MWSLIISLVVGGLIGWVAEVIVETHSITCIV